MTKNQTAWYAMRRTLPPWSFDANLAELIEKVVEYRVDEVIVKVDTEEFSHGHPTVDWLKAYQPRLFEVKEALERVGVVYSVNPWITVGHCDRGRDDRATMPGLVTVHGHDGTICRHCACPTSQVWRKHIEQLWALYAQTQPKVIWIEDDIRTFNHEPARYGCFCPDHLAMFSQRVGQSVTREALVAAILQPGQAHPWRGEYLRMQQELMIETVGWLGQLIHQIAPQTAIGLMSSGPRQHCLEGRDWRRFAVAMADSAPLYSRPPMGNYCEDSLRGFYYSKDSILITRHAMPEGVIEQTEVENVPFTRYSKSVHFTFVEMAISFAYGSHGVTMNYYDHAGTPLADEDGYGQMLRQEKDYLNALGAASQPAGRYRGVGLLWHPDESVSRQLPPDADYSQLGADGYEMMTALESAGIATTYDAGETVLATAGQTLRALSDEQLGAMLGPGRGLLIDAVAAGILVERGFGPQIGLASVETPRHRREFDFVISAEAYDHPDFGGAPHQYLTATLPFLGSTGRFARLQPLAGAQTISRWVDPDAQDRMPAMVAFENPSGGRVVVHGLDYASAVGVAYHHPFRHRQLQHVVRYLSSGAPALLFSSDGAYPLAWRKDTANHIVLGAFNLNLDEWARSDFELAWDRALPTAEVLEERGAWKTDDRLILNLADGKLQVTWLGEVSFKRPLVIRLGR